MRMNRARVAGDVHRRAACHSLPAGRLIFAVVTASPPSPGRGARRAAAFSGMSRRSVVSVSVSISVGIRGSVTVGVREEVRRLQVYRW